MDQQPRGTLLQMARMIQKPAPISSRTFKRNAFVDSPVSSDEEDSAPSADTTPPTLHTLTSAVSVLAQSIEREAALRGRTSRPPVDDEYRERPRYTQPRAPAGMDSELYQTVYESGFQAGLAQREPPPPCKNCINRREKNRLAAQEARKRAKLQQNGNYDENDE
jgi:hypothetical protein